MGQFGRQVAVGVGLCAAVAFVSNRHVSAGDVTLKNGLVLSGAPRRIQALTIERQHPRSDETLSLPFVVVDGGYQWFFIPKNQAARIDNRDDLSKFETFKLSQHRKIGRA